MVVGKDINRMKEFFHKIFALKLRILSFQFFFLAEECKIWKCCFLHDVEISENTLFPIRQLWKGFHCFRTSAALKIQNVWFTPVIEFTFSYAIQEKGFGEYSTFTQTFASAILNFKSQFL